MKTFEDFLQEIKNMGYDQQLAEIEATKVLFQEGETKFEFPENLAEQIIIQFIATDNSLDYDSFKHMVDFLLELYLQNEELTQAFALFIINKGDFQQIKKSSKSTDNKIKSLVSTVKKISKGDVELTLEILSIYALFVQNNNDY